MPVVKVDLTKEELATILQSLEFSEERVRDAAGTPYEVRKQNLGKIEDAMATIRGVQLREER